jgi:hypothetical protein
LPGIGLCWPFLATPGYGSPSPPTLLAATAGTDRAPLPRLDAAVFLVPVVPASPARGSHRRPRQRVERSLLRQTAGEPPGFSQGAQHGLLPSLAAVNRSFCAGVKMSLILVSHSWPSWSSFVSFCCHIQRGIVFNSRPASEVLLPMLSYVPDRVPYFKKLVLSAKSLCEMRNTRRSQHNPEVIAGARSRSGISAGWLGRHPSCS